MTINEKIKYISTLLPGTTDQVVGRSQCNKSATCDTLRRMALIGLAVGRETPTKVNRGREILVTRKVKKWVLTRQGELFRDGKIDLHPVFD